MVICTHIGDTAGTPYPPNEYGQSLAHFSQAAVQPGGQAHRAVRVQRHVRPSPEPARLDGGVPHRLAAVPLPVDATLLQRPRAGLDPPAGAGAAALPEEQHVVHVRRGLHRREDDPRPRVPDPRQRHLGLRLPARAGVRRGRTRRPRWSACSPAWIRTSYTRSSGRDRSASSASRDRTGRTGVRRLA